MKFLKSTKKNRGFTLIELLLGVVFVAIAGIGIYTIYAKLQVSNQSNTEARNLDVIRAGVKGMYSGNPNYLNLTNTVVNQGRVPPDSMRTTNIGEIFNTFGGAVTVTPVNLGGGSNNGFRITYPAVPGGVCSKLVLSAGAQYNQVTVAGTVVKTFGTSVPIDVAATAAACDADTVIVLFDSL